MEDRPYISFRWCRLREIDTLWVIVISAAGIRFYNSFHVLISDEVFNLMTIETMFTGNGFGDYFFRHPPLYLLLSSLCSIIIGAYPPYPQVPSFISILFSVLSLIPLYRIAEHLFGRSVALWASILISIMPASICYSGWIKQDGMLLFFFLYGVYFYLKESYWTSGITVGLALLVKEFALFFFPLSLLITVFFLNREGARVNAIGNWLKMSSVALVISSWWYLMFGTVFYSITGDVLTGGNVKELVWHLPWYSYINNLPYDLSYPVFLLFIIGVTFLSREIYLHGSSSPGIVLLLWFTVFYIPLSLMTVKTPWYTYLVTPPLAITAAVGLDRSVNYLRSKFTRLLACSVALFSLVLMSYYFNREDFYKKVFPITPSPSRKALQGNSWGEMRQNIEFWRNMMRDGGKVGFLEFHPIMQYLMGISTDAVVILRVSSIIALDKEGMLNLVRHYAIGLLIIDTESLTYTEKNLADMASLWGTPERIGPLLLFRTEQIASLK